MILGSLESGEGREIWQLAQAIGDARYVDLNVDLCRPNVGQM